MKRLWWVLLLLVVVACQPASTLTRTPTVVPTTTNMPSVTPTVAVPVHYKLRRPQPDELLKMIDAVLVMERNMPYDESVISFMRQREPSSLQFLIGKDFERYYPIGFTNAEALVNDDHLPWELNSFGDLSGFSVVLRIALLQYINNHQEVLKASDAFQLPNVDLELYSMDLDGDRNTEWLIAAEYPEYSLQNWLLIHKEEDGLYHELASFQYDPGELQSFTNEIEVQDLTGEGNPEILKIQRYYLAGAIHGDINVYTWKENKLTLYGEIDLPGPPPAYGETNSSEYVVADFNEDGIADIRVSIPRFRRFGCQWTRSETYYFDGIEMEIETVGAEIPETNHCLIARALESENTSDQIELYQAALQTLDASVAPTDQLAWVKLRLAMAYTALGDDVRAESQLQELIAMQGDGKYLDFIKTRYAATNLSSPLALCSELYSAIASQLRPGNLGSEIDVDLTHGAYPIDYAPLPDMICPFIETLTERLANTKIPASQSPADALAASGYSLSWTHSLNWDDDPEVEWLGVLNFRQPTLVMMDADDKWEIIISPIRLLDIQSFEANTFASAENKKPTVLVLFSGMSKFCEGSEIAKLLMEIHPDTMELGSYSVCDSVRYTLANEKSIQSVIEKFIEPYYSETFDAPDWYYLSDPAQNVNQRPILDLVSHIELDILSQTHLQQTAFELSELITSLPKDDPAAQILLDRLYYLLGLGYELDGKDELAVQTYLKLIETSPDSIWSKYAQLRLQRAP